MRATSYNSKPWLVAVARQGTCAVLICTQTADRRVPFGQRWVATRRSHKKKRAPRLMLGGSFSFSVRFAGAADIKQAVRQAAALL